jgi:cytochrome c-type biogenesis protein CcmH/NrfG
MQSTRIVQILLIVLTCGLIAFLFFNGRNNSTALAQSGKKSEPGSLSSPQSAFNFALLESDVTAKLKEPDSKTVASLKENVKTNPQSVQALTALAREFEDLKQPALAGHYYKEASDLDPNDEALLFGTGKNFFEAQQLVNDSASYAYFVYLSSEALDKVLTKDPMNLEAKADQAVNYIEGKGEPMKGVGLLREIIQVDSNNRKALFYLGVLSMQSNQLDKAVERFQKLISLGPDKNDPNYPYYFRYLGQIYMAQGDKQKALKAFMSYKDYTDMLSDPQIKQEAKELVESAKQ